jgi:hypothetical protein
MADNPRTSIGKFEIDDKKLGSWKLTAWSPGSGNVDVVIWHDEAVHMVEKIQKTYLEGAEKEFRNTPSLPNFRVVDAGVAQGVDKTVLRLDTVEMGSIVLTFGTSMADKIKLMIDEATKTTFERDNKLAT